MAFSNGQPFASRGLLLGWERGETPVAGFLGKTAPTSHGRPICYEGDSHLLTCAPTGMGKGRGVLIPNAILHQGSLYAVDPKGELAQVCARQRQRLGQRVLVLDPFLMVMRQSDCLNPIDLLRLPGADVEGDAEMLASLLSGGVISNSEPFWHESGTMLLSALIAHIATTEPLERRHLGQLRRWLFHEDLDLAIAGALDRNEVVSPMAREKFIGYLAAPDKETRPSIRATACAAINALSSEGVARTLQRSTFDLREVLEGRPLSIFIVIPPDKLDSHKALLRLWVTTLLTVIIRRQTIPKQRTLFLIDECAQLGTLPQLRQAVTLLRGSGLQVWSIWQDLSQLRHLYPQDWQTMVNNSAAIQIFGVANYLMAKEWAEVLGVEARELLAMPPEETLVHRHGKGSLICRRPDYLRDAVFAGHYDPNPRFALQAGPETSGRR